MVQSQKGENEVLSLPDEDLSDRREKSKRFIPKLMFLAAVARSRWDARRRREFDGKIGIWPFVEKVLALSPLKI